MEGKKDKERDKEREKREMRAGSVGLQAVNITQSNSGAHTFPSTLVFRNNYNCMQSNPTENEAKMR